MKTLKNISCLDTCWLMSDICITFYLTFPFPISILSQHILPQGGKRRRFGRLCASQKRLCLPSKLHLQDGQRWHGSGVIVRKGGWQWWLFHDVTANLNDAGKWGYFWRCTGWRVYGWLMRVWCRALWAGTSMHPPSCSPRSLPMPSGSGLWWWWSRWWWWWWHWSWRWWKQLWFWCWKQGENSGACDGCEGLQGGFIQTEVRMMTNIARMILVVILVAVMMTLVVIGVMRMIIINTKWWWGC